MKKREKEEVASLHEVISKIYERERYQESVSPNWLATQAMIDIGASHENERFYLAAHLQFRQIARGFCAKKFDPTESVDADDLFPDVLQHRYPKRPGPVEPDTEPEYVLLESLTAEDVSYNVERLRKEALAKNRHANALEAWGRERFPPRAA